MEASNFATRAAECSPIGDGWFVLPGLVDAHAHLITSPAIGVPGYTEARQTDPEELTRRVLMHLAAQRDGGVLAVRDVGAPTGTVVEVMKTLDPALPYLQAAGRFIAPPGRYMPNVAHEVAGEDIVNAANEEAARGGGWVKFIGDSSHRDHPGSEPDVGWTVDELRPAIEAARKAGARIAMHVTTPAAVEMAIALDIDSIEHGSHLKPAHLNKWQSAAGLGRPRSPPFESFSSAFVPENCACRSNPSPKPSKLSSASFLMAVEPLASPSFAAPMPRSIMERLASKSSRSLTQASHPSVQFAPRQSMPGSILDLEIH